MRSFRWIVFGLLVILIDGGRFLSSAQAGPTVVASIFPLYEIARDIGPPEAKVHLLLPPGADPHSWEPTPQDLLLITKAKILFVVGGGLEPWLEDLQKGLAQRGQRVLFASEGAPLLHLSSGEHHHGEGIDPHLWLDFRWDAELARRLGRVLAEVDPVHASLYRRRAEATAKQFLALDQTYRQELSKCRCRKLVLAGHAAFGYLARAYGLKMLSLSGLSPEAEPTPTALAKMIRLLKQEKVTAIFYEHPSAKRFATVLARETGVKIFYLTPGASLTQEEYEKGLSFFDLMERNLKYLREGLSCP